MAEIYRLSFTVQGVPKSLNGLLNMKTRSYHQYNNYKQEWKRSIEMECSDLLPGVPLEFAKIKLVRCYYRFLDYDNLVGSMKPVVDGLVSAGVLMDDKYTNTGPWDVSQEKIPKKLGGYVKVYVTEDIKGSKT